MDLLEDARLVLTGSSAARALNWPLPEGTWPIDAYVPEPLLVQIIDRYALEPDSRGDLVLRSVPLLWPFPAQVRAWCPNWSPPSTWSTPPIWLSASSLARAWPNWRLASTQLGSVGPSARSPCGHSFRRLRPRRSSNGSK